MQLHTAFSDLPEQLQKAGTEIAELKKILASITVALAAAFRNDVDIETLITGRAKLIDELLRHIWQLKIPSNLTVTLVAVGGYGRGELHPASDIDLLILVPKIEHAETEQSLSEFIMMLWDIGLHVGQSVRTPQLCASEADDDITIATALMESRLLHGNKQLFNDMLAMTGADKIWPSDHFFRAKLAEQAKRHEKYDDTAHNLEPNIKESPGGLRDIQVIQWVAKRHFGTESLAELVQHGFLTEREFRTLKLGLKHLWSIRFALHMAAGREEDRLLFNLQQQLAGQFEHIDNEANLAVEQFMQNYYRTICRLQRLNEMLLQYFEESILNIHQPIEVISLNRRFQIINGYIEAIDSQIFSHRPLALFEIFLLIAQNPGIKGIRASTIRLIHEHLHLIDRRFRNDKKAKELFLEILRQPIGVYHVLRYMNRYGLLAAYIPAFTNIVGRMQYDLFHVYTVDTHTLFLIRNLRRFTVEKHQHEFPLCSELMFTIEKQETLMIAALFHDIAKGRGGDHSELGAIDAFEFCRLHHLPEEQSKLVSWLVKNHLVMSMTAQRKDIEDPDVISNFAKLVGDSEYLKHLYLLTISDMRATNPKRWNGWKDALLKQLYHSTRNALENPQISTDAMEILQAKQSQARASLHQFDTRIVTSLWMQLSTDYFQHHTSEEIAWHTDIILSTAEKDYPEIRIRRDVAHGASEIFIIDHDRDNLFAIITWILDQCALNIVQSRLETSDDGKAINSFSVLEEDGTPIKNSQREEEIMNRLKDGLENLSEPPLQTRHVPRMLKHFDIPTEVEFIQDISHKRTMLRVHTADRPGLLSRIGLAFTQAEVRLLNAIIATIGERAEDTFFIVNRNNEPITDAAHRERIERCLLKQLLASEKQSARTISI